MENFWEITLDSLIDTAKILPILLLFLKVLFCRTYEQVMACINNGIKEDDFDYYMDYLDNCYNYYT